MELLSTEIGKIVGKSFFVCLVWGEGVVFELWRLPRGKVKTWPRQRDQ